VISLAVIFMLCLVLSAFFSGTEMAFVTFNRLQMRELAEKGDRRAQSVLKLSQQPQNFLASLLIGNNIVNVTSTAIAAFVFERFFKLHSEWLVVSLMAPVIIIFGEMVPKDYCRMRAIPFLLDQIFWLRWLQRLFHLPVLVLFGAARIFWPSLKQHHNPNLFVNEEEFRSVIEESTQRGIVGAQEEKLIRTILDFERIQVHSVMTMVAQIPMVDIHSKVEDVKLIARESRSRMMLVYEEIPSIIVGMIYVFDLLVKGESAQGLRDFLRAPIFIPETTSIEKAFLTLQQKRQSYAAVTDSVGNVKGVVPIDRLLIFEKH
jgi:CBS domain containing-hemolysin-like protein